MLKRWQKIVFLVGSVALLGAVWLWGSAPTPAYACDDPETVKNECEEPFDLPVRFIEKINVYRFVETDEGTLLCARNEFVYVNDKPALLSKRETGGPIYPNEGSLGVFSQETFEELMNTGVIDEARVIRGIHDREEVCVSWEGSIFDEDTPDFDRKWNPVDFIDPPMWKAVEIVVPVEGISKLFAYGYETEAGFYALAYAHTLE